MKDLGIVICNFNKKDYLRDSVTSILNADFNGISKDIIVVDNASSDGSQEMLEEEFPEVIVIQTGANLGGAGGFAKGMQYTIDKGYRYVSVLDNDTKVAPNIFQILKEKLDSDRSLGVAGATILQMDYPNKIQEMGAMLNYNWFGFELNYNDWEINNPSIPEEITCDYVPACCFMTTHNVLSKIGTFDPDFFIYFDDIDWCKRVTLDGYNIKAFRDVHVWHKGGAKLTTNTFGHYYFGRNLVRFFLKTMSQDRLEKFIEITAEGISKLIFFGNQKGQYGPAKTALISLDDAYSNRLGPQWHGIFPKITPQNHLYDLCKTKKNLLVLDNIHLGPLRQILKNLRDNTDATITLHVKNLISDSNIKKVRENISKLKNVTDEEITCGILQELNATSIENFIITDSIKDYDTYDLVIQSTGHVSEYEDFDPAPSYVDSFGNYIIDETEKKLIENYFTFMDTYDNVIKPVIEHKIRTIYNELHNDSSQEK
jgi:hypothetical protein